MKPGRRGRGRPLLKVRQVLAVAFLVLLGVLGMPRHAAAQTGTCNPTVLVAGQTLTVTGTGGTPGSAVTLRFNGSVIGGSTVDGFGNFTVSGAIPASAVPGVYVIDILINPTNFSPCNVTVQAGAVPATPTPIPTAAPADDDDDVGDNDDDAGGPTQEQNQEQNINFPVAFPIPHFVGGGGGGGGRSLPKTGADVAEVGGIGTATLVAGVTLMEFARRRRRHWLARVDAPAATIERSVPASVPPMPPRAGETEADLMLPYTATSPPPPSSPTDFITPTF